MSVRERLRVAVAGCRYFTEAAVGTVRDMYAGLAEVIDIPCEFETARPEAHLDEPETALSPAILERLRQESADVVIAAPGHRGAEPGLSAERIVPVYAEPLCVLEGLKALRDGLVAFVLRPAAFSPLVLAALLDRTDRVVCLPFGSIDHLDAQLRVAVRLGVALVITEPAAVPVVAASGLPVQSLFDAPMGCVLVHAVERALLRGALRRLPQQTHLATGEVTPLGLVVAPRLWPQVGAEVAGAGELLAVRTERRFVLVPQRSITYITSKGGVTAAYTDTGRFWTDQTLTQVEERLDHRRFLRVDQSRIINLARIAEFVSWSHQRYRLVLADSAKTELFLSRDVGRRLRTALGW